jgi:hypothetical protein
MDDRGIAAWKLPLIVAAIAVAIVAAFYVGGPGLGMAAGSIVAGAIVLMAVRNPPRQPIVPAAAPAGRDHLLVVLDEPLEEGGAIARIAAASAAEDPWRPEPEVRVVAPARNRFLDRWASATGPGRERAQRDLVLSLASLAGAGVAATARIGDEDVVQTVADQLHEYPATEIFLVTAAGSSGAGSPAVEELRSRLRVPFHVLPAAVSRRSEPPARLPAPTAASPARRRGSSRGAAAPPRRDRPRRG